MRGAYRLPLFTVCRHDCWCLLHILSVWSHRVFSSFIARAVYVTGFHKPAVYRRRAWPNAWGSFCRKSVSSRPRSSLRCGLWGLPAAAETCCILSVSTVLFHHSLRVSQTWSSQKKRAGMAKHVRIVLSQAVSDRPRSSRCCGLGGLAAEAET